MRFGRARHEYRQSDASGRRAEQNLPIDPEQFCPLCGSDDWSWVYPLAIAPDEAIALPTFWCVCEECHRAVEADDDEALLRRHGPDADYDYSFAEEVLPLFKRSRVGDALPRREAEQRP